MKNIITGQASTRSGTIRLVTDTPIAVKPTIKTARASA
jgi:hypothetical protein